jgi:excisionase family DNA binding protein
MEVITIESETFKKFQSTLTLALSRIEAILEENAKLKDDRWMNPKQAAEYLGFKAQWVYRRKHELKASQMGTEIRFLKSELDAYMKSSQY